MPKFFQKPQLGQANLTQAQKTDETGVNNSANAQAAQASKGVDQLLKIGSNITSLAGKVAGKYQENIQAKDRMASKAEIPFYTQYMKEKLSEIKRMDYMTSDELKRKSTELTEEFMKSYEEEGFRGQLKSDLDNMQPQVLSQMIQMRDAQHVKKVGDYTSANAASLAAQLSDRTLSPERFFELTANLSYESTDANIVISANESGVADNPVSLRQLKGLTAQQTRDSILKGLSVHLSNPENSYVSTMVASDKFRKAMGIRDDDEKFNKFIALASKKGKQADEFNYSQDLDGFKESLYTQTNQGLSVNIDKEVKDFRLDNDLTAQDEHKLRKQFSEENKMILSADQYIEKLSLGKNALDTSIGKTAKEQQALYTRAVAVTLELPPNEPISLDAIKGQLLDPSIHSQLGVFLKSGGQLPDSMKDIILNPSGSNDTKWLNSNEVINLMESSSIGGHRSIEMVLGGPAGVAKVRGLARLQADDTMDEATKSDALAALTTNMTKFNSRGYPIGVGKVDQEWLESEAKDGGWFSIGDLESASQNAAEIEGYYQYNLISGLSEAKAKAKAITQFKTDNRRFENPDGSEMSVPVEHKYLNKAGILQYAKHLPLVVQERSQTFGGRNVWNRFNSENDISIKKAYDFAKTGNYNVFYDDRPAGRFNYKDYSAFIGRQSREIREEITGEKSELSWAEQEEESLKARSKRIKKMRSAQEKIDLLGIDIF